MAGRSNQESGRRVVCCLLVAMAFGCSDRTGPAASDVGVARLPAQSDHFVWVKQQSLIGSQVAAAHHFGYSVALSGDTALGSGYLEYENGDRSSAYAFTRTRETWSQQQKLIASDGAPEDYYGGALAVSGDTALVGVRPRTTRQRAQLVRRQRLPGRSRRRD